MTIFNQKIFTLILTTLTVFSAGFPQMLVSQEPEALDMQAADVSDWPREILTTKGTIVIYQPEPESLDGNRLKARAAISIEATGEAPVFGAVWFEARLETDRSNRTALITDLTIENARLPNLTDERLRILGNLLESEIPKWNLPIHMDELIATLEISDQQARASETLSTKPPVILFYAEAAGIAAVGGDRAATVDIEEATGMAAVQVTGRATGPVNVTAPGRTCTKTAARPAVLRRHLQWPGTMRSPTRLVRQDNKAVQPGLAAGQTMSILTRAAMFTGKPKRVGSSAPVTNGKTWEVRVHRDNKAVSRQAKNPLNSKRSNAHNSRAVRKAAPKSPAEQVT